MITSCTKNGKPGFKIEGTDECIIYTPKDIQSIIELQNKLRDKLTELILKEKEEEKL